MQAGFAALLSLHANATFAGSARVESRPGEARPPLPRLNTLRPLCRP